MVPADSVAEDESPAAVALQRTRMRERLAHSFAPAADVLSVMLGDFNWVPSGCDRMCRDSMAFTGASDAAEEQHFRQHLLEPHGLYEMHQADYTHENAFCRSRLDRVYWNADIADQLDRRIASAAPPLCSSRRSLLQASARAYALRGPPDPP